MNKRSSHNPSPPLAPVEIQHRLHQGVAYHRQGKLAIAKAIYSEVLEQDPNNFVALHYLGLIAYQEQNPQRAAALIGRSLQLSPNNAVASSNFGLAALRLRKFDEALASFDRAITLSPDYAEAYNNRGNALLELQRVREAIINYDNAIMLKPNYTEAFCNRGLAFLELQRFREALESYDKALAISDGIPDAHANRGLALLKLQRSNEALAAYDSAMALQPSHAEAHNGRGNALLELGREEEALGSFKMALTLKPAFVEAHSNYGLALTKLQRFPEAIVAFDKAIELNPDYVEAHSNRGNALIELKRFDEALDSFNRAIALKPDFAEAHCGKSWLSLLNGNFESGWRDYENRKLKSKPSGNRFFDAEFWTGQNSIVGKRILIHYELYFGDTIQFCRYIKLLAKRGAHVLFAPQGKLNKLMQTIDSGIEVVDVEDKSLVFDFHCPLMSLPYAFKTDANSIPNEMPYLSAEADRAVRWREKIGDDGFKIGVCWKGSDALKGRAFPLAQLFDISRLPNVRLISLHRGAGEWELNKLPREMQVESLGDGFDAGPDAFLDTAAVMKCCDLVISCDTAVAHLAGALAVPTWVALKHVPEWRWLLDRADSPWYPTMRLFRQDADGVWAHVFAKMEEELRILLQEKS